MALLETFIGIKKYGGNYMDLLEKERFLLELKCLLSKNEFEENSEFIFKVEKKYHFTFIDLIKFGISFEKAKEIVSAVFEIECNTVYTTSEIAAFLEIGNKKNENDFIPEKLCSRCGKKYSDVVGKICDVDGCIRNRKNSSSEDYKRQVLVYPDYQKDYSFSSNNPLSLEDSLPLYPPQFSKIKSHKEFIDKTLGKLPDPVNEYEAFLPSSYRLIFKKDVYMGLDLNFTEDMPMDQIHIRKKINL